jgi:single-stranded DNA-binding protein
MFTVAVTRLADLGKPRDQQRTNWHRVHAWGKLGETSAAYLRKGDGVVIIGELISESSPVMENGQQLEIGGVKQYNRYNHIQASVVQFGQRPAKNQTPEQMGRTVDALRESITAMADGMGGGESVSAGGPLANSEPRGIDISAEPFPLEAASAPAV